MVKQAKHLQPNDGSNLRIHVCDWGGFIVTAGSRDPFECGTSAAFTNTDECAEWVRSFLRNATAKKFGAAKRG